MNNRSVGEKFIRTYSTDPMAVRTRNWRAKNKMRNAVQRKIYMSQEKNFVRVAMMRPFKPSNMFPKKSANSSYQRQVRIPDITLEGMYEELILHIQLMKDKFPWTDGRICRYCEKPWTYVNTGFKQGRNHPNFSVDRFNSDETYKKGNIVFCCTQCNTRKNSTTKKDWLKYLEIDKEINDSKD